MRRRMVFVVLLGLAAIMALLNVVGIRKLFLAAPDPSKVPLARLMAYVAGW